MPVQRIDTLNDISNDIMVARLEIAGYEKQIEELIASLPQIRELEAKIQDSKMQKEVLQDKLLDAMRANELKSWKTEQASFARASRSTATIDPVYKRQVEEKLKNGEKVENWELSTTEYISIRITPTK